MSTLHRSSLFAATVRKLASHHNNVPASSVPPIASHWATTSTAATIVQRPHVLRTAPKCTAVSSNARNARSEHPAQHRSSIKHVLPPLHPWSSAVLHRRPNQLPAPSSHNLSIPRISSRRRLPSRCARRAWFHRPRLWRRRRRSHLSDTESSEYTPAATRHTPAHSAMRHPSATSSTFLISSRASSFRLSSFLPLERSSVLALLYLATSCCFCFCFCFCFDICIIPRHGLRFFGDSFLFVCLFFGSMTGMIYDDMRLMSFSYCS